MSSERFFYQTKKELIDHILLLEKRHNDIPIVFCFNGHFFHWSDIETLISFMNANTVIKHILLRTSEEKYELSSFEEYRKLHNVDFQVLREFIIKTTDPDIEINMSLASVRVALSSPSIDQDTKEKEAKITEYLSTFLNKGKTYKGWDIIGNHNFLLRPPNGPDIDKLFV